MRKRFLIVASSMLLLCFSCLVSQAQNEKAPTYEIGGQIFSFGGQDLGFGWGAGGRFTYNLNNYIALDNELNFFLPDEGPPYATQGLFGIKAGNCMRRAQGERASQTLQSLKIVVSKCALKPPFSQTTLLETYVPSCTDTGRSYQAFQLTLFHHGPL